MTTKLMWFLSAVWSFWSFFSPLFLEATPHFLLSSGKSKILLPYPPAQLFFIFLMISRPTEENAKTSQHHFNTCTSICVLIFFLEKGVYVYCLQILSLHYLTNPLQATFVPATLPRNDALFSHQQLPLLNPTVDSNSLPHWPHQ